MIAVCSKRKQFCTHAKTEDNQINESLFQKECCSSFSCVTPPIALRGLLGLGFQELGSKFLKLGPLLLGGCSKILLYALLGKPLSLHISYRLKPSHPSLSHQKNENLHVTSQFNKLWGWQMYFLNFISITKKKKKSRNGNFLLFPPYHWQYLQTFKQPVCWC